MNAKLEEARARHSVNPTTETAEALASAQLAYDKSPEGIRAIRRTASEALSEGRVDEGVRLTRVADSYSEERETRLALHDLFKSEFGVREFAQRAQERANVPEAYKEYPFITQQGLIGFASDDVIGSALNYRPEASGYVADFSYSILDSEDSIVVFPNWSLEDEEGAIASENFGDYNELDPDHRPTKEEAARIASELDDSFNENSLRVPDDDGNYGTDRHIQQDVAESIVSKYNFAFEGGEELREQAIEKLKDNIFVSHSVTPVRGLFSSDYVLDTWDSLYGD